MGTPRPTKDPQASAKAAKAASAARRQLRWWCGRMLSDSALSDAEWDRYLTMRTALQDAGLTVEYYKVTVAEPVGPALKASMHEHYRRTLNRR